MLVTGIWQGSRGGLFAVGLALLGALSACSSPAAPIVTQAPAPTFAEVETVAPVGGSGIITFGAPANLDEDTLAINPSKDTFKVSSKGIAWSAELSEPAGATSVTWIVAKVSAGGAETGKWSEDVDVSNPSFTILANSADLAFLLDRKAGTYVMRYLRDDVILAEGKFTLTK